VIGAKRNDVNPDPLQGNVMTSEPSNGVPASPSEERGESNEETGLLFPHSSLLAPFSPSAAGPEGCRLEPSETAQVACSTRCHVAVPAPEGGGQGGTDQAPRGVETAGAGGPSWPPRNR
jgi:hypothetical protein